VGFLRTVQKTSFFLSAVSLLVAATSLPAQNTAQRADAAVRAAQNVDRVQAAATATLPNHAEQAEIDLGEQQQVDTQSGTLGLWGAADTGLFYTSNANLTPGGGQGDMYFFARGAAGLHPHLGGGLFLDGFVTQEVFEYARFSNLDFLKFSAGGGLDYVIPGTNGLTASVKYKYERFLDTGSLDEFFVNNALDVGLAKEFAIGDIHAVQIGWRSSFSLFAEPDFVRRDEHTFWVGWRWRIVEPLELQLYDFLSLYYYPNMANRFDVTNYSGAALNLALTSWAQLSASAGFAVNSSSQSIFNYTAANVGGTLSLNVTF
jgi:hypothetical protein